MSNSNENTPNNRKHSYGLPILGKKVSMLYTVEGSRGYSLRTSIVLRYIAYLLSLFTCCLFTQAILQDVQGARNGGRWMLVSASIMLLTAVYGTMRFPQHRVELIRQARHFVFGIAVVPGTVLAVFMWATQDNFVNQVDDSFAMLLINALPILYFVTVLVPAAIFVKTVAGLGNIYRTKEDDQESVSRWTRQDGFQP